MNEHEYNSLFSALNQAVEILHRNRTPDPALIAAYDTLKQARAMLAHGLPAPPTAPAQPVAQLIAA